MKVFLLKSADSVFFLVPARDIEEAESAMRKWEPGNYTYAGETEEFSEASTDPIAMVEIDLRVRLHMNLGLQTSQIMYKRLKEKH